MVLGPFGLLGTVFVGLFVDGMTSPDPEDTSDEPKVSPDQF